MYICPPLEILFVLKHHSSVRGDAYSKLIIISCNCGEIKFHHQPLFLSTYKNSVFIKCLRNYNSMVFKQTIFMPSKLIVRLREGCIDDRAECHLVQLQYISSRLNIAHRVEKSHHWCIQSPKKMTETVTNNHITDLIRHNMPT